MLVVLLQDPNISKLTPAPNIKNSRRLCLASLKYFKINYGCVVASPKYIETYASCVVEGPNISKLTPAQNISKLTQVVSLPASNILKLTPIVLLPASNILKNCASCVVEGTNISKLTPVVSLPAPAQIHRN